MYHLRLIKARSYCGAVEATRQNPDVFVEDGAVALSAVASGYFKLIMPETEHSSFLTVGAGRTMEGLKENPIELLKTEMSMSPMGHEMGYEDPGQPSEGESKEPEAARENGTGKILEGMTVPELETFAACKGISLRGIARKADMITRLKEALPEEEAENEVDYGSPTMLDLQEQ